MNITSLFTPDFTEMMVRFVVCLLFVWFIIDRLYYRKSKRRDFYFTFLLTSIAIFFLVYFMIFGLDKLGGKTSMGIGIGLFGIFSIMRYRTDTMPVREMTYLFSIISLSVVNAIASSATLAEIIITNIIVVAAIWICESRLKIQPCKTVQYDRIELIRPERQEELKRDLEQRLGLDIKRIEVGGVDLLKDTAIVKVYYNNQDGRLTTSADDHFKARKEEMAKSE